MKKTTYLEHIENQQEFKSIREAKGEEEMLEKKVSASVELLHTGTDYDYQKGVLTVFPCGTCGGKIEGSFLFMQRSGTEFSIDAIVNKFKAISEEEILHKKVAIKGNPRYNSAEAYSIFGTNALAKITACSDCWQPHLTSFCTAEHQPGRNSTIIKGTWMLKRRNKLS